MKILGFKMLKLFQTVWIYSTFILVVICLEANSKLKLLKVTVPTLIDRNEKMNLECHFDMGGEDLNSVKWYKDEHEFFRYMPTQDPPVLLFPVFGVTIEQPISDDVCTEKQCKITLGNLTRYSTGDYKCEVSTEAPTFRVVFKSVNVTVAVLPKKQPKILGLRSVYSVGEMVNISCFGDYADPPTKLSWLINNKPPPQSTSSITNTFIKSLEPWNATIASRSTLKFQVDRKLTKSSSSAEIRCISTIPEIFEAPILYTAMSTTFKTSSSFLSNEKLEWYRNSANYVTLQSVMVLVSFVTSLTYRHLRNNNAYILLI